MMKKIMALFVFLFFIETSATFAYKLNDGHIHYNHDVWDELSAQQALDFLAENNINRAIVSSTPNVGTEKLSQLSPQRIIAFLRPYRIFRDRFTWHSDPSMPAYIKQKLTNSTYKGFGEFHLFKEHKNSPVVQKIMQIIADHNLTLSAHSDAETIEALISMQPQINIIWAHCGMDHPVEDVRRMLNQYPNLYCELSFRYNMFDEDENLLPQWEHLLELHAKRFILGMDTYRPPRWAKLDEHADFAQHWLTQLPPDVAILIARQNIDRMFPKR